MENSEGTDTIINFWFSDEVRPLWFNSTDAFDAELRERFLTIYQQAANGELQNWENSPQGCLALVIILDQFPLNMFRGDAKSFATESEAIHLTRVAIERQFDQKLSDEQKAFLYMPLMHSENLKDQDDSVRLFEQAGLERNAYWARHHHELVRRFGRFPHRNAILGRESTKEELEYLASPEAFSG